VAYRFSLIANLSARALAGMYTRKFTLTLADWKTLAIVGHFAPVYPGAIAQRTSMLPEQVSRALDRLVTKGVVERSLDASDRRRVVVTLSAAGRKAFAQIEAVRAAMEDDLLGALSRTERDALFRILDKIDQRAHAVLESPDAWKRYVAADT
jgi:DNA-binding MarR family transcriptional regulator